MKTFSKLIFLSAILLISGLVTLQAQETGTDTKKKEKSDRKKQKEAEELADWESSRSMAEGRQFVFSATQLITNDGTADLDPKINFFYVMDDEAVIQFGLDGVFIGGNGVGGVTSVGTIDKYIIKGENPKKPVQVELTVRPNPGQGAGIHNLVVKFFGEGFGEVFLNASGYRLKGQITTPDKAVIYEGNRR
ncbi:MAG: hypothetical protein P8100_01305 [bacterium]|jgi:hypothetical protein